MSTTQAIEHVTLLLEPALVTLNEVRPLIVRLVEEAGLDASTIISMLIDRQHQKREDVVMGKALNDRLGISDLRSLIAELRMNEPTEENRAIWRRKFESGTASNLCPRCGYAGTNEEFNSADTLTVCPLCSFVEDTRYFKNVWSADEKAAFEKERAAKAALRLEHEELERRQAEFMATLRGEAMKAVEEIDRHQGDLAGEAYGFVAEEAEPRIRKIMALMGRTVPPIPYDDVVVHFKANLRPKEDYEAMQTEFARVAKNYDVMMTKIEEEIL